MHMCMHSAVALHSHHQPGKPIRVISCRVAQDDTLSEVPVSRRRAIAAGLSVSLALDVAGPGTAASIQDGQIQRQPGILDLLSIFKTSEDTLPPPIRFPRRPMNTRFAVLLMQSGYKAAEDLKFVPMDAFQIKFWKLRQQLWPTYVKALAPSVVRQGDLSDPAYFDFVSAVQYMTLSVEFPKGQQAFEEYCATCPTSYRSVQRDASLADNASLPPGLLLTASDRLYNGLSGDGYDFGEGGDKEIFNGPAPVLPEAPLQAVLDGITAILGIFESRGFCTKATLSDVQHGENGVVGSQFTVTLTGGANLWGLAALVDRKSSIANVYDALAVNGFLRASGLRSASYVASTNDTETSVRWTI